MPTLVTGRGNPEGGKSLTEDCDSLDKVRPVGWVGPVSIWTGSPVVTGVGVTAEPSAPDVTVAEGSTERWIPPPTSPPAESAVAGELAMALVMKLTNDGGKVAAKAALIIVAKSGFLTGEEA